MKYNSIKMAIPKKWKNILKKNIPLDILMEQNTDHILQKSVNNINKHIYKITNKDIYRSIIKQKGQEPTSINTWYEMFPFMENNINWEDIFLLPYTIVKEPYLQSFQYKILNRIINCNEKLYTWKLINDNKCKYCGEIDTLEHHFFDCQVSKSIWERLYNWTRDNLETHFRLALCDVLFGIPINMAPLGYCLYL